MKLITAIIKPFKLDESPLCALRYRRAGHHGHRSEGFRSSGSRNSIAARQVRRRCSAKVKVEAAISDELAEQVITTIEKAASTGKIGDGKIFIFDLEQVVRIRTGESGVDAL